jgi:NitT/TauT family transport system ATP-binding protein
VFLANRIVVLGANPGTIRIVMRNELPHPRDPRSPAFLAMMDTIHDIITKTILPDEVLVAATPMRPFEPLPQVTVGEILGLLEVLDDHAGSLDAFDLAFKIGKDFGSTLTVVKAAELLDFVDTPRQMVVFTEMGRRFLGGDVNERKILFRTQLRTMRSFAAVEGMLHRAEGSRLDQEIILEQLAILLPNEDPERLFDTLVGWGRYGELFGYTADDRVLYLDTEEESAGR